MYLRTGAMAPKAPQPYQAVVTWIDTATKGGGWKDLADCVNWATALHRNMRMTTAGTVIADTPAYLLMAGLYDPLNMAAASLIFIPRGAVLKIKRV